MAASLVESMAADFEPEEFTDSYREAVAELIDAKLERGESAELPGTEEQAGEQGKTGEVIDLLTALQRSVNRARGQADEDGRPSSRRQGAGQEGAATKAPAKKAPAKKAPAKKRRRGAEGTGQEGAGQEGRQVGLILLLRCPHEPAR